MLLVYRNIIDVYKWTLYPATLLISLVLIMLAIVTIIVGVVIKIINIKKKKKKPKCFLEEENIKKCGTKGDFQTLHGEHEGRLRILTIAWVVSKSCNELYGPAEAKPCKSEL